LVQRGAGAVEIDGLTIELQVACGVPAMPGWGVPGPAGAPAGRDVL